MQAEKTQTTIATSVHAVLRTIQYNVEENWSFINKVKSGVNYVHIVTE